MFLRLTTLKITLLKGFKDAHTDKNESAFFEVEFPQGEICNSTLFCSARDFAFFLFRLFCYDAYMASAVRFLISYNFIIIKLLVLFLNRWSKHRQFLSKNRKVYSQLYKFVSGENYPKPLPSRSSSGMILFFHLFYYDEYVVF